MVWHYHPGYQRYDNPIGNWNCGRDHVGVPIDFAKYDGDRLPLLADGDIIRLFPLRTIQNPNRLTLAVTDLNTVPLISEIQMLIGLAYKQAKDEGADEGRFPVETEDPGRYQEFFCTVNMDSVVGTAALTRVDITDQTSNPVNIVLNNARRQVSSIRDIWKRTPSTSELPDPYELDVVLTINAVATTANPMTGVTLVFAGAVPDRVKHLSESDIADILNDEDAYIINGKLVCDEYVIAENATTDGKFVFSNGKKLHNWIVLPHGAIVRHK